MIDVEGPSQRWVVPVLSTRVVLGCVQTVERELPYSTFPQPVLVPPPSSYLSSCSWLPLMMGSHLCHVLNSFLCKLILVTVLSQQQNPSQGRLHCVAETDLELLAPSQSPASASRVARLQIHMTVPLCGYSLKRHTIEIELELAYIMK